MICNEKKNKNKNIKNIINVFFLGISSGIPLLLILTTLNMWLSEIGFNKTKIGLLAWVTIPYSIKFLAGPIVDKIEIPIIKKIGQRKSWLFLSQLLLILSLNTLGSINPNCNFKTTIVFAFIIGLISALQDTIIEAYRIEIIPKKMIEIGITASVL